MDRVFGNYLLTRRIGAGGMGEVYQAVKRGPEGFEVEVALKLIIPHLAGDASFRAMFSREARLAALLKHPNIVHVHGFDILEDIPFIEMEYVQGVDLASLLRRLPRGQVLSLAEAVHVVHCVARGLAYAHSFSGGKGEGVGVVHRDLNPHNILVSREGEVKIADFGIARAAVTAGAASATLMGKLAYMSPEQVEGKPLDHRSDLFSLGTTAYHLLAGRHPFQRQSEAATLRAIEQVSFRPLRESAPDVPLPIARMVESLLALLPGDRPQTARLVAEAFQEHLDPAAPRTLGRRIPPDTAGRSPRETEEPTAATLRRARRPGSLMLGGALAAAAAFLFLFMGIRGPEPPPGSARPAAVAEAPAAPAGPTRVVPVTTLTVRTDPPGAEITADGVRLGKAPVEVTPGQGAVSPELEARLYGYEPRSFSIPGGTRGSYTVSLSPLPTGTLRISAVPWAAVRFRGEAAGETPLVLRDIPVGTHPLILVNDAMGVRREVMAEVVEGINTINVDLAAGQ